MNLDRAAARLLDDLRLLRRVERIFARYCRDGKRPTREEAAEWLQSLGWKPAPLNNLLAQWGYEQPRS
jgi:hypothetical protein